MIGTKKWDADWVKVRIGSVVDTHTGRVYPSRSECIKALGRDAVPMLRDKRYKRLRIITMQDRNQAMFAQGDSWVAMAAMQLEGVLRDIEKASEGGLDHNKFGDIAMWLKALVEDLDISELKIREAGDSLTHELDQETFRNEFRIDIRKDIESMVQRL